MDEYSEKQIIDLLNQVNEVKIRTNAILDATGARYNIFRVLGVSDDEVAFSKVIGNLLNIKGEHRQKGLFVEKLIKVIAPELEEKWDFDYNKTRVEKEYYIGEKIIEKEPCKSTGGRIDILIEIPIKNSSKRYGIIIENKINAGDQQHQLIRYNNFAKKEYGEKEKDYKIFYLTKSGYHPSKESCGFDVNTSDENIEDKIFWNTISYANHICEWLEECIKESYQYTLLQGTLIQFKNQIERITGQDKMAEEEIINILKDNLNNSGLIMSYANKAKCLAAKENINKVFEKISTELKKEIHIDSSMKAASKFWIYKKDWKHLRICFEFEQKELHLFKYGLLIEGNTKKHNYVSQEKIDTIFEFLKSKTDFICDKSDYYLIRIYDEQWKYWSFEKLNNSNNADLQEYLLNIFKKLEKLAIEIEKSYPEIL